MEKEYLKESLQVVKELGSNVEVGLTTEQVNISRSLNGENVLTGKKKQSLIVSFLLSFLDPLILILIVAAIISLVVAYFVGGIHAGDWFESGIIVFVVVLNAIIGVIQESNAEKSLEALKKMSSPLSRVLRNGQEALIPTAEIVVGDILLLEAGDILPADARIIECANVKVDESALTGESVPVEKIAEVLKEDVLSVGDRKNMLFSSTPITNGRLKAVVTSTGMKTEVGKIATMLINDTDQTTPLQDKLAQVGKAISLMCIVICVVVFGLELLAKVVTGNAIDIEVILDAFKSAVALAVAAIPEGLATVVTIVLALGVSKMAKANAIVKKLPAVETLGSTSVVCSDKTGTLTLNQMTVLELYRNRLIKVEDITIEDVDLIKFFAICSDAKIVIEDGLEKNLGDPTEIALIVLNNKYGEDISNIKRIAEIPFDSERKLMTVVVNYQGQLISITKGAPDIIVSRSAFKLDTGVSLDKYTNPIHEANENLGNRALRVLGLAIKYLEEVPSDLNTLEENMQFVGLVGMIDPPRAEVKVAIAEAKVAGIRSVMITGDHIVTAVAIAKQLGILNEGQKAITSTELQSYSDEYLLEHIEDFSVYARANPSDKVRIVDAWQKKNKVVAMTGDGVNDSPALKRADIGCAMGITGTNVSKEASDMILMDDNFATIILAIKEGRGIYDNLKKCIKYLLSSNIGEVLTIFIVSLITVLFGSLIGDLQTPLLAIHLLWINLITDALPAFALGMEKPQDDVMSKAPRSKNEGFFAHGLGIEIIIQGIFIGFITITAYLLGVFVFKDLVTDPHMLGQTMAFFTLSGTQLFHSFNIKSSHTIFSKSTFNNKFLIFSFLLGFGLQFLVIYLPGLNDLFKFVALPILPLIISLVLGASTILLAEIMKIIDNYIEKRKANK
ncbi:MAG: calcium-translocating P-type ATPase, PMCA-type [Bacillales bacterium]|jgi:Ca2+-transporting ATPase|nr:calcium-translocating P-type ATPase, PMCA-type [Bacillales bacterium]